MTSSHDKNAFFRQSSWMVLATVAGGVFMSAVHVVVNKPMKASEYAVFFALLRVFLLMGFPAGGLQVVFAQQAAAAVTQEEQRKLTGATLALIRGTFLIWLAMAGLVFVTQSKILALWEITNPAALWVTVLLGLASLWSPICKGILQGRQDFAGLGWVLILDGVGRFTAIVVIVQLGGQAAGAMAGALTGQLVSLGLGAWLIRDVIRGPGGAFEWRPWLAQVVPLTLGVGVVLFMSTADVVYVQSVFSKNETPFYTPAAMIGLAMMTFTTPLAAVMFPKVVQSAVRTQTSDALSNALVATALLGGGAALACTLLPNLPVRIIYFRNSLYWTSAEIVPWFAWALLPLILANVLVGNLLARRQFAVVPWLVAVAVGYAFVLSTLKARVVFFTGADVVQPATLADRIKAHSDPAAAMLLEQLQPAERDQVFAVSAKPDQKSIVLAQTLNRLLNGPSLYTPEVFPTLSPETKELAQGKPGGKELLRLNRLLLQETFSRELISPQGKLFGGFKKVVGTLGIFSTLLLGVALWFTYAERSRHP